MRNEILLTDNELESITSDFDNNPSLQHPYAIAICVERTSICKVTPKNHIIIIKGDEDTGFEHINNRHNYWINEPNWVNGKLDNPSKFNGKSAPIIDYSDISDELYCVDNLNSEKNKAPDLFDLYIGKVDCMVNGNMKYRMLLYKDTKILHTLFPENKINNRSKKKVINYHKGDTVGSCENGEYIIETPWLNESGQVIYNLVVYIDLTNRKEKCILLNSKEELQLVLFESDKNVISTLENETNYIGFSNFTPIERKIKEFEKKILESKND